MLRQSSHTRRSGFTLTEMLVASALIIFMMWILSSAFEKGLSTFSQLKTAGDLQEKLRAAATMIRQDLISPHFDETEGPEYVSGQRLDRLTPEWKPPLQGYFRIYQDGASIPDGLDPDDPTRTLMHTRTPEANKHGHMMQFTVKQKADRRDRYYVIDPQDLGTATDGSGEGLLHKLSFPTYNNRRRTNITIPGGGTIPFETPSSIFTSNWAEITYFVRANGATTGGTPLYSLYRRQNLIANEYSTGVTAQIPANDPKYLEVSAWKTPTPNWPVNSQKTVTAPSRRFGSQQTAAVNAVRAGAYVQNIPRFLDELGGSYQPQVASDLLLTDITDFEIKVMWDSAPASGMVPAAATPQPLNNPDFPFDQLPPGNNPELSSARVFDTWSRHRAAGGGSSLDDYGTPSSTGVEPWNNSYSTTPAPTSPNGQTIPLKIRVRAVQIELRIWDVKTRTSRQITIIQDL